MEGLKKRFTCANKDTLSEACTVSEHEFETAVDGGL